MATSEDQRNKGFVVVHDARTAFPFWVETNRFMLCKILSKPIGTTSEKSVAVDVSIITKTEFPHNVKRDTISFMLEFKAACWAPYFSQSQQ